MTEETADGTDIERLSDPETLVDRGDVPVTEVERTLGGERFEGMREHYSRIDGVVQVGITTDDGQLLLQGSETAGQWAPPGGPVGPGQDWVEAARQTMETQTGVELTVDSVELCERLTFRCEDDPTEQFSAYGVSFAASPVAADAGFLDDPAIVDHPHLPPDHDQTFAWFDGVPDDANENHVEHIERFLD